MSRAFGNDSGNNLQISDSLITNALPQPCTMVIRLRPNATGVRYALFSNNNSGAPKYFIGIEAANTIRAFLEGADRLVSAAQTFNVGEWHSIGVSYRTDDSLEIYLNGASVASGSYTKAGGTAAGSAIIGGLTIAGIATFDIDGDAADFGFYNAGLSDEDHAAYGAGIDPHLIRPNDLVSHVPIIGAGNAEFDGLTGREWTVQGTLTKADHPPIFMPSPAITGITIDVSAFTGTISLALPFMVLTSTGEETLEGAGALTLPSVQVNAVAVEAFSGVGTPVLPFNQISASGTLEISGASGIQLPFLDLNAIGTEEISGAADVLLPFIEVSAVGVSGDLVGDISVTLPFMTIAAAGELSLTATSAVNLPFIQISASASEIFTSTASLTLPSIVTDATGNVVNFTGNVSTILPFISVASLGQLSLTGSAAVVLPFVQMVAVGNTPDLVVSGKEHIIVLEDIAGVVTFVNNIDINLNIIDFTLQV